MSDSLTLKLSVSAENFEAGTDKVVRSSNKIVDATRGAETATIKLLETQAKQQRSVDALSRRLDPLGQAVRDASRDLERLTRISQGSGDAAERASRLLASAQARVTAAQQAQAAGMRSAEVVSKSFATQTGQTSNAMRQLGIQSIDVFQQLASGAPVMTTFIQQGGQIGQVMAVSNTSIGAVAKSIGGFIAANLGVIGATAGMVAFGAATYAVFQRASDLETQQRQLSVAIAGVGRSAELSGTQLQGYITQLKHQGVAAAEAQAAVVALARNPGLSGGAIARIVGLAPDAAAASGQSIQDAARLMSDAMKGTVENVQKLDEAFNLLTAAEAASIRQMIEHGDKGKALEDVFAKLEARITGVNEQALSPMEKAFRDMTNSWDGFMTKVVNSGPVVAVMSQLAKDVRAISGAMFGNSGAELSQEIVAVGRQIRSVEDALAAETGTGRLADARRQSMNAALAEYRARETSLIDRARAEVPPPPTTGTPVAPPPAGGLSPPADAASKSLATLAAARAAGSDAGRIAALSAETDKFRAALKALDPAVEGNKALVSDYTRAIAANEKSIADLNKKNETHRTGLEKAGDTLAAQIKAQRDLAAAYGTNDQAVRRVLATQEAEKKAISDGLTPGTAKYAAAVAGLTVEFEKLADVKGTAVLAKEIAEVNEAVKSQERITAAYDGTQGSLDRVQAQEKAHAAALKAGITPAMEDYEATVSRLSESYLRSTDAAREFQHAQSSVTALFDTIGNAADRLGQGLVDAFLSGSGAAVNFGNLAKSALASVATDVFKLGLINPARNALLGSTAPTLSAALGATGSGGLMSSLTSGGLMGNASSLLSMGGITDTLGLTNFGGWASGLGQSIGLPTGGITGLLNTPIFGSTHAGTALLDSMGITAGAAGTGPLSIGGALSGIGGGFTLGSLAGGFVQSSMNKVGPAPQIGAGVGALAGTLAFGPLGGIIGGLLGGGGGGLIGPKAATPFSATGLNNNSGQLGVGQTFSQIVDVSQEVATLQQQVDQINAIMAANGTKITNAFSNDQFNQNRIIGGNSGQWLNFGQGDGRPGDLNAAFGELRFGSDNQYIDRAVSGKSFANVEALQAATAGILDFVNTTAPALKTLADATPSFGAGTLTTTIDQLSRQFDGAIATAERLGYAEYDLTEARTKAIQIANDNAAKQLNEINQSFLVRTTAARGIVSGSTQMQLDAALLNFDIAAEKQRETFRTTLLSTFGDAFKETQAFADQMAAQEAALGAERLVTAKSYLDQIASVEAERVRAAKQATEQAAGNAAGVVQSITAYLRDISGGAESVLSPSQKYNAARSDFETTLSSARGGDASALSGLTSVAETFRAASRAMFGSGTDYVRNFERITEGLRSVSEMSVESLTSAVFTAETRTQTQVLTNALADLRAESARQTAIMQGMRDDQRRASSGPPASRAA